MLAWPLRPLPTAQTKDAGLCSEPGAAIPHPTYSEQVIIIFVFLALLQDILHSQENVSQIIVICKSRLGNFACF